jgi:hypothetical protein
MSEHTPGRLVVRGGYSIYTADDKTPVADTCLTNSVPDNDEANARRLVAAWNACEGIPTKDLEELPEKGFFHLAVNTDKLAADLDSLRAVNAELLAELHRLADIEQEHRALLVNEQNLREELAALRASLGEPYGWHYTNNGGASVFHKGPSNKLDADMQSAADYPKVHRVKTLYALTNKETK